MDVKTQTNQQVTAFIKSMHCRIVQQSVAAELFFFAFTFIEHPWLIVDNMFEHGNVVLFDCFNRVVKSVLGHAFVVVLAGCTRRDWCKIFENFFIATTHFSNRPTRSCVL
jgi:hypothetical protein